MELGILLEVMARCVFSNFVLFLVTIADSSLIDARKIFLSCSQSELEIVTQIESLMSSITDHSNNADHDEHDNAFHVLS